MNRKKKLNQILTKKAKRAQSKKAFESGGCNKHRYISKAERAKMEAEEAAQNETEQPASE
ncbi:DUF2986 domain-containing protein [Oceanospirillum sanctuarii]|uniref:DUF2986 domain-containing protein n=1 Tax=Oceanospirillum sanctuarii TaxID=1434821 RepID=UPI000A3D2B15|nr:DUF2986 domain-containing protein [Oceanospirillum sanctuarii]